jgi:hypothetical protein
MRPSNLVPSFYFYKLADSLSGPYTALSAYSAGVIDAQGNILKPESSIDAFEYLVIKLKKIIDQLPYGMTKAQLGNYLSAIHYFSEAFEEFEITQEQFHCMMEGFVCQATNNEVSYLELLEDMSVGAGGGAPGSLGTPVANSQGPGVAGYDPKLGMPMQRRKQPKYFDNCEVFEVCPEEFIQFKAAKQWKDIPEGENKNYIQRFQRRNKNTKVAVKSLNPLNGENEMHWISYPAHNFMENINLKNLTFLFEQNEDEQIIPIEPTSKNINQLLKKLKNQYVQHVTKTSGTDYSKITPGQDLQDKGQSEEYYGRLVHTIDSLHKFHKERNNKDSKIKDIEQQFGLYLGHLNKLSEKSVSDPGADTWGWNPQKGIHKIDIKKVNFTLRKPLATTDIPTIESPSTQKELEKMIELAGSVTPKSKKREKQLVRGGLAERGRDDDIKQALMQIFAGKLNTDVSIAKTLVPDVRDPSVGGKVIPSTTLQTWAQDETSTTAARPMLHYPDEMSPAKVRIQKPELHSRKGGKQWKEFLSQNQNLEQPTDFSLTPSHFESLQDIMKDDDLYKEFYTDHHLQALINPE